MVKTTIYVATHKLFLPPFHLIYKPIVSGAKKLPYKHDQKGENIANKNPFYSELTILYWIWKNDHSKYVGLTHYHRYFFKEDFISKKEIEEVLQDYDLIVPEAIVFNCSLYEQYASVHYKNDLSLACEEIVKQDSSYKSIIDEVLNGKKYYGYNMFISKKDILDEYASFLFSILFSLEKRIPYLMYSPYNRRVFGFLSERIFNIYLRKKQFSLYEYPIKDTLNPKTEELRRVKILNDIAYDNANGRLNNSSIK